MTCNDARRNLTDFQETSQWLGGSAVPRAILTSLQSFLPVIQNSCET